MVPLTGQNTINDMVDRINEVTQEIENVSIGNANAVHGPETSVANQLMAFADSTGKQAKVATNVSAFAYSILDDVDDAAMRVTLGLKSAAVLDAATAATPSTVVQRDASGNITGVGITATSGFVGNGSQITSLNMGNAASGTLGTAYGGTGTTSATGTGSTVRNTSPTFAGAPLSTTAAADTNTTQIATTAFVIGQASSTSPVMNGTATVGASLRYARADHVHPSDTSKVNTSLLGVANGVATLDSGGKVPTSQLPAYVDDVLEYANQAAFPATGETGKIYVALDTNKTYRWSGSAYIYITSGAVDSVAGKTGVVTLVKGDVGLGNVDNTSDATKSIGGNAATATKLATSRTISATGDATWSTSFDGSANATSALTLANSGVAAGTYPKVTVDAKGRVTAGAALVAADVPALDAAKITSGVFADARLSGTYTGVNITGNAETATKLALRPINVTAADNTNRWTPVYTWTFGGQYNSFSARLWIIGRGNFDTQAEVECRAEYSVNAFGIVDLDMWSVSGVPTNLELALVTDDVAKTATLYFKSPSAWENYSAAIMNEYTSGAVRSTPSLVPSTTEPVGNVVRKVSGATYKRLYTNDYRPFADRLTTARTINGVEFDGSANITVADSTKLPTAGGTLTGDLTVGATSRAANTFVRSLAADGYNAGFEAYGAVQGTGYVYVGQSPTIGGGIFYNGDGTPAFATGEGADRVSFYRQSTLDGKNVVFSYHADSNDVVFRGAVSATSFTGNASSATKLATARNINGKAFDGTANIEVEGRMGTAVASAATITIGTAGLGETLHITGTTTITSLGVSTTGTTRRLIFDAALTLTHNATSLICPGAANIVTAAGTVVEVVCENGASGYWRVASVVHPAVSYAELSTLDGVTSNLQTQLNAKAALASPALTGAPTAPTAAVGTNTTQLATTAYTVAEIGSRAPTKTGTGASGTWAISVSGSAATLTTPRTLTIGNTGKTFNGSADVTWTLDEIGGAGSGATGGDQDKIFMEVDQLVTSNWTIGAGEMNSGVTISIAAPGVFTYTAHGLTIGQPIRLTTTGALPSGLSTNVPYYVVSANFTPNTFSVSATEGGAAITTTGTQSGTHSFGKLKNSLVVKELKVASGKTVTVPSGSSMVIVGAGGGDSAAASYVNTSTNQTIAGAKNFTSAPTLNGVNLTSIGVEQTWQDVTAGRTKGTPYVNNTGRPILVTINPTATASATSSCTVDGIVIQSLSFGSAVVTVPMCFIVPTGSTYQFDSSTTILRWVEMR